MSAHRLLARGSTTGTLRCAGRCGPKVEVGVTERYRMTKLFDVTDFLHPLDLAARQQLEGIPLLQSAVKKYLSLYADRQVRQTLLSSAVRLGPRQLPEIYRLLPPICDAFGIPEPELYLTRGTANAAATGHTQTAIIIYNELLEDLAEDEIQAVLAHECGHILAEHVLYRQIALAIVGGGERASFLGGRIGAIASIVSVPLQTALLNWYRKSELTADRAAVAFMGNPEPMQRALFRIIGVPKWMPVDISFDQFAEQADEFDAITSSRWDRFVGRELESGSTHPIPASRIRELAKWSESENCRQLMDIAQQGHPGGRRGCPACGQQLAAEWRFCQRCGVPVASNGVGTEGGTR